MNHYETYKSIINSNYFLLLKEKVAQKIKQRNLHGVLNDAKWVSLFVEFSQWKMPPCFDYKSILVDEKLLIAKEPPTYLCDWDNLSLDEYFIPYIEIEQMIIYGCHGKYVGRLVPLEITNQSDKVREVLDRLNIPYSEESDGVFLILGYT